MLGAASAFPSLARAESFLDMFARNQVLNNTNRQANTTAALDTLTTNEPILSVDTANNIQAAIAQYTPFVAAGGWKPVSRNVFNLILGNNGQGVVELKYRMMASGDMAPQQSPSSLFDGTLDQAVRTFQARHGLTVTGKIDEPTFYAMQVPAEVRLSQLQLNLARVQNLVPTLTDSYIVANIPAAKVEIVEQGQVLQRHTAVVGRIDRPTPILNSKITGINFNPYWHVPKSIIQKDLIPEMRRDPTYLSQFHIRTYDGKGQEVDPSVVDWTSDTDAVRYNFTQDPGSFNSEGHVKINFPSPDDVYMHDTPEKELFAEDARFDSSGCMRVQDVDQVVAWLLQDNEGWDQAAVDAAMQGTTSKNVTVKKQQPIHTTYITAWANRQGTVSFRNDVYQYDAQGKTTFDAVNG
jgi:murein L,D-transpeptidase YcbB/YkuD